MRDEEQRPGAGDCRDVSEIRWIQSGQTELKCFAGRFSLWGEDHDFTMEEVLSEITYFRGESYHTVRECGEPREDADTCIRANFSDLANLVRSSCGASIHLCKWNNREFNCCEYFRPMRTELGICFGLNSLHAEQKYLIPSELLPEIVANSCVHLQFAVCAATQYGLEQTHRSGHAVHGAVD